MADDPTDRPPLPRTEWSIEVSDETIEQFRIDGFTHVDRITTDEELAWMRLVYDELFARRQAGLGHRYFDLARPYEAGGHDLLPQILFPEQDVPELRDTVWYRNARAIAAALLDEPDESLHSWGHMIDKPPRVGHETPWHQDEAYWDPGQSFHAVGMWMPLDDVDETNGCMTFLPGSHRLDVLEHRHIGDDPAVHGLEIVDPVDTSAAVAVCLAAGGATFHHPRTLHATSPNRTDRRRRACAAEFQTAPVDLAERAERPWVDAGRAAFDDRKL